ncbi:MAG: PorP/SprF family type IX secretion system membrane protein [Bacteroidales bacterium]|jgi:type IX secretion system PorP/SprF family membrane protein|nr:PorP/SprF family type IX secretion system membrane protein [Bacteroidales bacterium]
MDKHIVSSFLKLVLILLLASEISAQDIHFSQYYASPLSLNPAETGRFDASLRFSNNYRTQWNALGTPFKTISVGFDTPFKINEISKIGAGIFFINDKSGGSKLTVNKIFASISYIFTVKKHHEISIGLQPGFILKNFDQSGLSFPTQFDPESGLFNSEYNRSSVKDNLEKLSYFDLNAGVHYSYNIGKLKPYGGASFFHLTMPNESFTENKESKLGIRMAFNGGVRWSFKQNFELNPSLFVMYNKKASDWLIGSLVNYYLPDKVILKKIFAGAFVRYSLKNIDSFILTGGVNIWDFDLGISYDLNLSRLIKATHIRGALEASLIYKFYRIKSNKITIPCDRY